MLYLVPLLVTQIPQDVVVYNAASDAPARRAWAAEASALREAVERRGRAHPLSAELSAELEGHRPATPAGIDLGPARDAFARFEHSRALALLAHQERTALGTLRGPQLSEAVADIALLRGQVALAAKDPQVAQRAFRLYARCAPERDPLDPARHPPAVITAAKAGAESPEGPPGALEVSGLPAGARIRVDGAAAPADLSPGPHLLTAEAPGHRPHAEIVDVLGGHHLDLRVALVPSSRAERVRAAMRRGDAGAALAAAGAPAALIIEPVNDRSALVHLLDGAGGRSERVPIGPGHFDGALALLGPDLVGTVPPTEPPKAWYQRWWVWSAVGVIAAAGATTGVLLATQGSDAPPTVTCCGP